VMGASAPDFVTLVVDIVNKHVAELDNNAVTRRDSRAGKYLSLTVTVQAQSQQQLDNLYRELSGHERILMVL